MTKYERELHENAINFLERKLAEAQEGSNQASIAYKKFLTDHFNMPENQIEKIKSLKLLLQKQVKLFPKW